MSENINNAVYDEMANTWWDNDGFLQGLKGLNPGRFDYLKKLLAEQGLEPQGMSVVDVGCGGGYASEHMAKMGMQVIGVDPSKATIQAAKKHAQQSDLDIDYRLGAGEAVPLEDDSCDLVFCCDVLEHVDDVQQVIKEIYRVLKPGGLFFYDTINRTAFSWFFLIKVAQDFPPTRVMPKNTHVWHMFIKPKELETFLQNAGFTLGALTGFAPGFSPTALVKASLSRLKGGPSQKKYRPVTMGASCFKAGLYMGWAEK